MKDVIVVVFTKPVGIMNPLRAFWQQKIGLKIDKVSFSYSIIFKLQLLDIMNFAVHRALTCNKSATTLLIFPGPLMSSLKVKSFSNIYYFLLVLTFREREREIDPYLEWGNGVLTGESRIPRCCCWWWCFVWQIPTYKQYSLLVGITVLYNMP